MYKEDRDFLSEQCHSDNRLVVIVGIYFIPDEKFDISKQGVSVSIHNETESRDPFAEPVVHTGRQVIQLTSRQPESIKEYITEDTLKEVFEDCKSEILFEYVDLLNDPVNVTREKFLKSVGSLFFGSMKRLIKRPLGV